MARSQVAVSWQPVSKHALYIRLRKIVADKKQPTAALHRKGVGNAIAEIQRGRCAPPGLFSSLIFESGFGIPAGGDV